NDHRSDDRGKGPIVAKQPQARENRVVLDTLNARVVVEETNEIDWCDKCFLPHPPCEANQQLEEVDDDDNTDDACMVDFSRSSQQGVTSTEVIT
ncbi:hypothetical protein KI387_033976, partial [Taxus chinensis]